QMMEIALLENLQRENLSAIEEAIAYRTMIERLNLTQDDLSKKVGKSRSHITNILGLLRLPNEIQQMISKNELTMGHARVISKLESEEEMINLAKQIVEGKLPVRETERISNDNQLNKKVVQIRKHKENLNEYKYVEDLLREKLDTKIKIKEKKLEISFSNINDLNRILEILNIKE
ncbi:MAG: ParB/RepB/Spo0J family partition protein, partial [Bacilli bacterium]